MWILVYLILRIYLTDQMTFKESGKFISWIAEVSTEINPDCVSLVQLKLWWYGNHIPFSIFISNTIWLAWPIQKKIYSCNFAAICLSFWIEEINSINWCCKLAIVDIQSISNIVISIFPNDWKLCLTFIYSF